MSRRSRLSRLLCSRYDGAKQEVALYYHGTIDNSPDPEHPGPTLRSILSQGLIPSVKQKNWDESQAESLGSLAEVSKTSLGGIYVTTNLGTATLAAVSGSRFKKLPYENRSEILVVMQLQPRSLLADEDMVGGKYIFEKNYSNDSLLANLTHAIVTNNNPEYVEQVKSTYVADNLAKLEYDFPNLTMHPGLEQRLRQLYEQGFMLALERQLAYMPKRPKPGEDDGGKFSWAPERWRQLMSADIPYAQKTPQEAERAFKGWQDRLTRTLKNYARPVKVRDNAFRINGRMTQPIGFTGKNRIVCIVQTWTAIRAQVVRYGTPPVQFIKDWEQVEGPWNPIDPKDWREHLR